ncbi:MAG TPA: hypothetical protein VK166_11710 [Chitinophagaceae bacterium]|nr:hypothetical protein [Chitinophagaceae bacterium]
MKKIFSLISFAVFLTSISAFAQKKEVGGEISLGARFGGTVGATLKRHGAYNKSAIEFIAQFKNFDESNADLEGFSLTGLYQKLAPLSGSSQLSALFGGGVSMNFERDFNLGVSGMIGFDWRLKKLPITLQVDWMPTYFFINTSEFTLSNAAISARYVLNRRRYSKN